MTEIIKDTEFNKKFNKIIETAKSEAIENAEELLNADYIIEKTEQFSSSIIEEIFLSAIGFKRDRYDKNLFSSTCEKNLLKEKIEERAREWTNKSLLSYIENYKPSQKLLNSMKRTFEYRFEEILSDKIYELAKSKADEVILDIEAKLNGQE